MLEAQEGLRLRLPEVEPAVGADPEEALGVAVDRTHPVGAQAGRVAGVAGEPAMRIGLDLVAVEAVLVGADPEHPGRVFEDGTDAPRVDATLVLGAAQIGGELAGLAVEAVEAAAVGAHPQPAGGVLGDAQDAVVAQAAGLTGIVHEPLETRGGAIEAVQPTAVGAHPDLSGAVLVEHPDHVARQGVRVGGVAAEVQEGAALGVPEVEAAALRPDPQIAAAVFEQRQDPVVAEARRVLRIVPPDLELVAVEAVESVLRADPDEAVPILQDGVHVLLRQAFVEGQPVEADVQLLGGDRRGGQRQQRETDRDDGAAESMALPVASRHGELYIEQRLCQSQALPDVAGSGS